ncbi:MAG: hypothetical protein AB8B87_13150 [Granulosicoccus sp.]
MQDGINTFVLPKDQRSIGIGARFDLSRHFALKAQIDRISRDVRGVSFDRPTIDNAVPDNNDVTLFSVVLDFVFQR